MGCSVVLVRKIEQHIDNELEMFLKRKYQFPYTLDRGDLQYLSGLVDGGFKGATKLIEAIEKYDEITLELRC